jgi:hypothetical protein
MNAVDEAKIKPMFRRMFKNSVNRNQQTPCGGVVIRPRRMEITRGSLLGASA